MTPMHTHKPLFAGLALAAALSAQATPITTVPVGEAASVITFAAYNGVTSAQVGSGIDVGASEGLESVVLNFGDTASAHIVGAVSQSLGNNGSWPGSGGAYVGLNAASGDMSFSFGRGLGFVGGFINFDPGAFDGSVTITAFDQNGDVLEDASISLNLGNASLAGAGAFYGFSSAANAIWSFSISNSFAVIDDLTFSAAPTQGAVPEPGSLALVLGAIAGLALTRRRA